MVSVMSIFTALFTKFLQRHSPCLIFLGTLSPSFPLDLAAAELCFTTVMKAFNNFFIKTLRLYQVTDFHETLCEHYAIREHSNNIHFGFQQSVMKYGKCANLCCGSSSIST